MVVLRLGAVGSDAPSLYYMEMRRPQALQIIALARVVDSKLHGDFNFLCARMGCAAPCWRVLFAAQTHPDCARYLREQNYDLSALDQMEWKFTANEPGNSTFLRVNGKVLIICIIISFLSQAALSD